MAITRASLTGAGSNTDAVQYQTASISPTANRLIVACYNSINLTEGVDPTQPTVSGNGLTWAVVDTFVWRQFGDRARLVIAAADTGSSPSSGVVTFNHGSQTQEAGHWSVFELNGTDVANGVAQSFVQFVHSTVNVSGTSIALTLAPAGDADNRPFLAMAKLSAADVTRDADFTEIHDVSSATPPGGLETQERLDAFDIGLSGSWTGTIGYGGIGFEVKAAGAALYERAAEIISTASPDVLVQKYLYRAASVESIADIYAAPLVPGGVRRRFVRSQAVHRASRW